MSRYAGHEWNRQLVKFLNLLIMESREILWQIKKEKVQLLRKKKELEKNPLCGLKTSPIRLLQWIVEKILRRKITRIEKEITEIGKLGLVVASHLENCKVLRENILAMEQCDICESLKCLLEGWFVFDFSAQHYRKFIKFPSEVRFYQINQLIGE